MQRHHLLHPVPRVGQAGHYIGGLCAECWGRQRRAQRINEPSVYPEVVIRQPRSAAEPRQRFDIIGIGNLVDCRCRPVLPVHPPGRLLSPGGNLRHQRTELPDGARVVRRPPSKSRRDQRSTQVSTPVRAVSVWTTVAPAAAASAMTRSTSKGVATLCARVNGRPSARPIYPISSAAAISCHSETRPCRDPPRDHGRGLRCYQQPALRRRTGGWRPESRTTSVWLRRGCHAQHRNFAYGDWPGH